MNIESLLARIEALEAEVAACRRRDTELVRHVLRSGALATPDGFHYCEEAVSEAFGFPVEGFYGAVAAGRPRTNGDVLVPDFARRCLYHLLHHFFGYAIGRIQAHYRTSPDTVKFAVQRWLNLTRQREWDSLMPTEQDWWLRCAVGLRRRLKADRETGRLMMETYALLEETLTQQLLEAGLLGELTRPDPNLRQHPIPTPSQTPRRDKVHSETAR